MANLSQQRRQRMLDFLQKVREKNKDDDDALVAIGEIENEITEKKYGLVWEEHSEEVEERMVEEVPVFTEVHDKEIALTDDGYNFLLEGDNLHSLHLLEKTHKEKIDVIYIDPPYNMGEKDFMYDDSFVDSDDAFRHSKWLSFMHRRLLIARTLLSEDGYIFISIDDHELAQLRMLCDSIFGEQNFISNSFVLDNLKGKTNDSYITSVGSRVLVYAKNRNSEGTFKVLENIFGQKMEDKFKEEDEDGLFNGITFKKTGQSKFREDRPNMYYPILQKDGKLFAITEEEYQKIYNKESKTFDDEFVDSLMEKYKDYEFILPLSSTGEKLRWTSRYDTFLKKMNIDVYYDGGVKQKTRPAASEMLQVYASGTPKNLMYKPSYSNGTQDLKDIMDSRDSDFPFPKPVVLIKDLLSLIDKDNYVVLDFFAGSGTTGQAVLELNKEDGGNRKFILCTNNENNICEGVTYPRLQTVITGVRQDGNKYSDGIPANLKYYKTDYIPKKSDNLSADLIKHIDEMIQLEYHVKIDKDKYISVLTDEDADELEKNWQNFPNIRAIYISRSVLLTGKQRELFETKDCFVIPDYYFREELRDAGEA